jgi:hypothetical protein
VLVLVVWVLLVVAVAIVSVALFQNAVISCFLSFLSDFVVGETEPSSPSC